MMEFEIVERDLLARIGRFKTKTGTVETPLLLPVINPVREVVKPKEMYELLRCEAIITNAYIVRRHYGEEASRRGIHSLLDYPGVVMTDSGAYQILVYGKVETTPEEIVRYQEDIGSDIATILDVPTGWVATREHAQYTVEETLRRAEQLKGLKRRKDIAWVGPVQGGRYLDLIAYSAERMSKLQFDIHALGSPTPVMEQYLFDFLVDMIMTAKVNLPPERPFHLFGAGHPFMFSLAVALGCDLFDSASYSLYAREDRYMTPQGTIRLSRLKYLPCSCPICVKSSPRELLEMPKAERERALSMHNLYVCFSEIRGIKQAIIEGRLWEYLEVRAHGHPALLQALKRLKKYGRYLEEHTPVTKRGGVFFFSSLSLARPEVARHEIRLLERFTPPKGLRILLLLPSFGMKPYERAKRYRKMMREIRRRVGVEIDKVHPCIYSVPFGVTPIELVDVYPLSQYEIALPPDRDMESHMVRRVTEYVKAMNYEGVILVREEGVLGENLSKVCGRVCSEKGIRFWDVPSNGVSGELIDKLAELITDEDER